MTQATIAEVKDALAARGVRLNAGLHKNTQNSNALARLPASLRELYLVFDGFPEGVSDPGGIRIWTLREVIENLGNGPVEFADFLIGSHTFAADADRNDQVVDSNGEVVARTVAEFLTDVSSGKHDFL